MEDIEYYFQIGDNVTIEVNPNDYSDYQVFTISHGSPSGTIWYEKSKGTDITIFKR